jgi:hypothetical protein
MAMASLFLNIPDDLKAAAVSRAAAAGFASVDDYVASLIEDDRLAPLDAATEAELLKGLDSGPPADVAPEFWTDLKQRVRGRRARGVRAAG